MFTPDLLLKWAGLEYASLSDLNALVPVPTQCTNADHFRDSAKLCAVWMQREGIPSIAHIGPFLSFVPTLGKETMFKKGFRSYASASAALSGAKTCARAKKIVVHRVIPGRIEKMTMTPSLAVWYGPGGKEMFVDLCGVVKV